MKRLVPIPRLAAAAVAVHAQGDLDDTHVVSVVPLRVSVDALGR